ncbi:MAG: TonB-dependent siderophore receptor [Leptolyngbyaceae cyanobacterium CSU_1_3]|nr:TonB-dependent siderophore receptor [Leptolyngbyaceae cyanobacterium CSU_1_3]
MKVGLRSVQVSLWVVAGVLGSLGAAVGALPVVAQEEREGVDEWASGRVGGVDELMNGRVDEAEQFIYPSATEPATTVTDWIAQIEASLVQITGVRVETTETGLQIVLETAEGELATPTTQTVGNALIAEIPNAVLALPEGSNFEQFGPAEGIALVSVTNEPGNRVRVAITGTDAPPVAEVTATGLAVTLGEAVVGAEDDAIQVVVTGEQDQGYNPSNATTATRTDTPLRDIPASITVVPRQVLEDRNVRTVTEALETVAGVPPGFTPYIGVPIIFNRIIRGFNQAEGGVVGFRNGFPDGETYSVTPSATIEQVEVLRGPASVLFGAGEPGGIVNVVTRQPLSDPYYRVAFEAGNFGFYESTIDFSGPLNANETVLYRFIAAYQGSGDFQGFADTRVTTIAPSLTLRLGERTELDLYYEFSRIDADPASGYSNAVFLSDGSLSPRGFLTYYPSLQQLDFSTHRFGYTLNHEFSDNWQLRNNVAIVLSRLQENNATGFESLTDDRFLDGFGPARNTYQRNNLFGQVEVLGRFNTGTISHQVLAGFDFNNFDTDRNGVNADEPLPPLDIRNPNYDIPTPTFSTRNPFGSSDIERRSYGVYLQDQITLSDNLKFLIGGRYDWVSTDFGVDFAVGGELVFFPTRNDSAFSPRVGLVYQPSEAVSLYASYTRSFFPISTFENLNPDVTFDPTRGTQYEVGVKTDFLDGRLSATLAAYHLTRTNVLTPDPNDRNRSIQTGEQRSQGIEFEVRGEILPGWDVTAAYAYTDAELTQDNTFPVGNRLPNVPENQASLWTTYTIQEGALEGLGFGLGLFYLGARQANLDNSLELGDYLRTDAALYYRRDRFRAAINFRNIFDIDAPVAAFSELFVQRTEPFTVVGSVSWEF